jgi:hypothetical protein
MEHRQQPDPGADPQDAPPIPLAQTAGNKPLPPPPQPAPVVAKPAPAPPPRPSAPRALYAAPPLPERRTFDVRGFLAGFALSWAIGAVLYVYLVSG